jgi:hypothetical protein
MKHFLIVLLASLVMPGIAQSNQDMYPRLEKAQKYDSEGFALIDCFAGQARVHGKRIKREPFSVFLPDSKKKCCGTIVKNARTDEHGHFVIEPLCGPTMWLIAALCGRGWQRGCAASFQSAALLAENHAA